MDRTRRLGWCLGMVALLAPVATWAYQAVNTPWPGSAKGTVRIKGALAPPAAPVPNGVDPQACGAERPPLHPQITPEGRLSGALVFLENMATGRALLRRQVPVDVRDCALPSLSVLAVGDELQLGSLDSVPHHVTVTFEADGAAGPENWGHLALVPQGQRARFKLTQPGWITVRGVGSHPWLLGVFRVLDHPYAMLTLQDGSYDLRDVPAGTYTLHVWHPQLGSVSRPIDVKAGYPTRSELELDAAAFSAAGAPRPR